jgi:hypothetical protein
MSDIEVAPADRTWRAGQPPRASTPRAPDGTLLGVLSPNPAQVLERPGESLGALLALLLHLPSVTSHIKTVSALAPVGSSRA